MSSQFFDDKPLEPKGKKVYGSFQCRWCDTPKGEAFIDMESGDLRWNCPEGHPNRIKEFMDV